MLVADATNGIAILCSFYDDTSRLLSELRLLGRPLAEPTRPCSDVPCRLDPGLVRRIQRPGWFGSGSLELECYTNRLQNAQIKGGNLVVTATQESVPFACSDGSVNNYTSARLKTQGLFSQAYGRFEARIKIPTGQGMWPAFWMLGNNVAAAGWPTCGEIDIMENIGRKPGTVHGSLHGPSTTNGTSDATAIFALPAGQAFADDFHVYAIEWEPGVVRFYVDSNLYATFAQSQWSTGGTWVFDHPFFIILNVAVGGNWPGSPDSGTVFPQQMLVDYVRVYTKQ